MKTIKKIAALAAISALFLTGCTFTFTTDDKPEPTDAIEPTTNEQPAVEQPATSDTSITYKNDTYGFSIELPQTWKDYKVNEQKIGINNDVPAFYFELKGQDEMESLMAVAVYTKEQWMGITEESDPITFNEKIGENTKYVFVLSWSQDNSEVLYPRRAEVADISKTFKAY